MPTPLLNKLTSKSKDKEIRDAVSECIDVEVGKGRKQAQAIAMCMSMAEKKIGRKISHGGG